MAAGHMDENLPGIDSTMGWLSLLRFSLARLLQLCVFRFCSDENGDVWVGVFPQPQKILICCARLGGVALERVCSATFSGPGTSPASARACAGQIGTVPFEVSRNASRASARACRASPKYPSFMAVATQVVAPSSLAPFRSAASPSCRARPRDLLLRPPSLVCRSDDLAEPQRGFRTGFARDTRNQPVRNPLCGSARSSL